MEQIPYVFLQILYQVLHPDADEGYESVTMQLWNAVDTCE